MDSVSNGVSRKVASEFGTNHSTVPMSTGYLPQMTLVLFGLPPGVTVLFFALYTEAHLLSRQNAVSPRA